jgi:Leucine-rich repeat (LRR) protein
MGSKRNLYATYNTSQMLIHPHESTSSKMSPLKSHLLSPNLCPEVKPKKQSSLLEVNPEESSILSLPQESK